MKLFTKYNRINFFATLIIFLSASAAFFFLLRFIIIDQVDRDLTIEQNEIETSIKTFHRLPAIIPVRDQTITYTPVKSSPVFLKQRFRTVRQYDDHEKEEIFVRRIEFNVNLGEQSYLVTVTKSLEGTDNLIQSIIIITICTILLILAATLLINRIVLRKLWHPFYDTLQKIRDFKLGNKLNLSPTDIDEFDLMNKTLRESLNKAEEDYILLREFTENASHELQTPLAVIRSKLDLLVQDEHLSEQQSYAVQGAYDAIQRLTRLSRSLLLLAKIGNKQFADTSRISLKEAIQHKAEGFHELWTEKEIRAECNVDDVSLHINHILADILLNNLFSNATRHNIISGNICIKLSQNSLTIKNTGVENSLDEKRLFSRFYKPSVSGDNHGLGLSIIKQICEVSGLEARYFFENPNIHVFRIFW